MADGGSSRSVDFVVLSYQFDREELKTGNRELATEN
jgi:hypothetical protein